MFETLAALAMGALSVFWGAQRPDIGVDDIVSGSNCTAPAWVKPGVIDENGMFEGVVTSDCTFQSAHGGNYNLLEQYAVKRVTEGTQVNSGPTAETYKNLPSTFYDVTMQIGKADTVTARQDVHIATDHSTQMIFDTFSTQVTGTGTGKYLKEIDSMIEVHNTVTAGTHTLNVTVVTKVQKPWFAPDDTFLNQVKPMILKKFKEIRDQTLPEIQQSL